MRRGYMLIIAIIVCISLVGCNSSSEVNNAESTAESSAESTSSMSAAASSQESSIDSESNSDVEESDNALSKSDDKTESDSNTEQPEATLELGETASTDIIDFTLTDCDLSIYAENSLDETFLTAVENNEETPYVAEVGSTLVIPTFTITNKNRVSLSIGEDSISQGLTLSWNIIYDEEKFDIIDVNAPFGASFPMDMNPCVVIKDDGYELNCTAKDPYATNNQLIDAGETISFRTIGTADFEPESLNDSFKLTIDLLNSDGEREYFTYSIPER